MPNITEDQLMDWFSGPGADIVKKSIFESAGRAGGNPCGLAASAVGVALMEMLIANGAKISW